MFGLDIDRDFSPAELEDIAIIFRVGWIVVEDGLEVRIFLP